MKLAFTKRNIEALEAPARGRTRIGDTRQPGLYLYLTPAGKRVWYVYRKLAGRPLEYRLGEYPALTIEQARKAAAARVAEVANGVDIQRERVQARRQPKLSAVWRHWLETHARPHLRPRSISENQRLWKAHLEPWADRRLSSIATEDVRTWHQTIGTDSGRWEANRALGLLRTLFTAARELGHRGDNPVLGVKRYAEPSRDRFLSGDEIKRLYVALNAEDQATQDYVRLSLLTGARRNNVRAMRWADVDLSSCVWAIPADVAKSGKPIYVPLADPALAILTRRKETTAGSPWVFPATENPLEHIPYGLGKIMAGWQRARKAAGIPDVRLHDLRRSLATLAVASGASLPAVGRLLGHSNPKATAVYARADLAAIRAAVSGAVGLIETATAETK